MIRLKILILCDSILDSQISKLKKAIWELQKGKACVESTRLEINQEREKQNVNYNSRERSRTTKQPTIH